jgi:uncharacterized protein (DUF2147 family)
MRKTSLILAVLAAFAVRAHAADPAGEWRVEDGDAHIWTAVCAGRLWGIVSWERKPGTDAENPDPSLRNRPTLGLPIILGMTQASPSRWQGSIYNAENGKTYRATITLRESSQLDVEGCVLDGWVCSSETWTRVSKPPSSVGSAPVVDMCLRLGIGARPSHQGRLK